MPDASCICSLSSYGKPHPSARGPLPGLPLAFPAALPTRQAGGGLSTGRTVIFLAFLCLAQRGHSDVFTDLPAASSWGGNSVLSRCDVHEPSDKRCHCRQGTLWALPPEGESMEGTKARTVRAGHPVRD